MSDYIAHCVYGFGRAYDEMCALINMAAYNENDLASLAVDGETIEVHIFEIEGSYDMTINGPRLEDDAELLSHDAYDVDASHLHEIGKRAGDLDIEAEEALVEADEISLAAE